MPIDYKKELERAAKNMILVHDPDTLIKMIVRTIAQKVKVSHVGILLQSQDRDTYVLTVSRGPAGLKIPAGFARMDKDNPLIHFFREHINKEILSGSAFVYEEANALLLKDIGADLKELLKNALYQMEIFGSVICVPSYYKNDLLGLLLLGNKKICIRFYQEEIDFFVALASDVAMSIKNAQLFKELELELDKKHQLFLQTTLALAAAIEAKDNYTHGHTNRVTNLSLEIATRLIKKNKKVSDDKFLENLYIAGLLHDIGKIGIPEYILNKIGGLTVGERNKIKEHPLIGELILKPIKELDKSILGVKYHHERYDGSGYPDGLKGNQIPLIASIISVADAFDAMITDRPYRLRLSKEQTMENIKRESAKQFNPLVVDALVELYQEGNI